MAETEESKVKIRFKFKSGEEFEAEGSPEFIEKQRADFLQLIGKDTKSTASAPSSTFTTSTNRSPSLQRRSSLSPQAFSELISQPAAPTRSNAFGTTDNSAAIPTPPSMTLAGFAAAERLAPKNGNDILLWEQVARTEDNLVILRRKSRLLNPETAALVLIGAAKALLGLAGGLSALSLSKALDRSGYGAGRLDRILAREIKRGTLRAEGSKRSRAYTLSDEGFARAYVLAGKLAEEWQ